MKALELSFSGTQVRVAMPGRPGKKDTLKRFRRGDIIKRGDVPDDAFDYWAGCSAFKVTKQEEAPVAKAKKAKG